MEDLKKQLFNLAVIYGLKNCYSTLDSLRDTIKLHGQFLIEECNIVLDETNVDVIDKKVEEMKMESSEVQMGNTEVKTEQIEVNEVQKVEYPPAKVVKKKREKVEDEEVPKGNAKKRWQREQEALKRIELKSKGIFKEEVLTIENLTLWINAGRSYADIARSEVGCSEEEVSRFCKRNNII